VVLAAETGRIQRDESSMRQARAAAVARFRVVGCFMGGSFRGARNEERAFSVIVYYKMFALSSQHQHFHIFSPDSVEFIPLLLFFASM
jgi:hypothetical protein